VLIAGIYLTRVQGIKIKPSAKNQNVKEPKRLSGKGAPSLSVRVAFGGRAIFDHVLLCLSFSPKFSIAYVEGFEREKCE